VKSNSLAFLGASGFKKRWDFMNLKVWGMLWNYLGKVNSLITQNKNAIMLKIIPLHDILEIEELESRLILKYDPEWNIKR